MIIGSLNLLTNSENSLIVQRIYGVVTGIAIDNKDPDNLGKVKVKFPWLSSQDVSYWARIATPMAGTGRGIYFLPEIEDEVLVVFENGDIRFPYILGGLWSSKDNPPINNSDGKNNQRLIKSRSGHTISLNDENGKETIEIIDKSQKNKIIIDTANNAITIDSNKDITLKASQGKIILEAESVEIKTSEKLEIKTGDATYIQGMLNVGSM